MILRSLILWTSTSSATALQRLLLLLLELLYNLFNIPTFILAVATPGTNARVKPGAYTWVERSNWPWRIKNPFRTQTLASDFQKRITKCSRQSSVSLEDKKPKQDLCGRFRTNASRRTQTWLSIVQLKCPWYFKINNLLDIPQSSKLRSSEILVSGTFITWFSLSYLYSFFYFHFCFFYQSTTTLLANAQALKYHIGNHVWARRDELTLED